MFVFESVFESCKELRNLPETLLGKKRFTKQFSDTVTRKRSYRMKFFRFEQLEADGHGKDSDPIGGRHQHKGDRGVEPMDRSLPTAPDGLEQGKQTSS